MELEEADGNRWWFVALRGKINSSRNRLLPQFYTIFSPMQIFPLAHRTPPGRGVHTDTLL